MDLNALNFVAPEARRRMLNRQELDGLDEQQADVAAWETLSGAANNLLQKMLFAEPKWRIGVQQAMAHKFVRQGMPSTRSRRGSERTRPSRAEVGKPEDN